MKGIRGVMSFFGGITIVLLAVSAGFAVDVQKETLRQLTPQQIREVVKAHEKWLETGGKEGEFAFFSAADLRGVNLVGADLRKANFYGANLTNAILKQTKLNGADFREANLKGAVLDRAHLQDAKLLKANLGKAYLGEAVLSGAILINADLSDAILWRANLREANLDKANLSRAYLLDADLFNTTLTKTILRDANLVNADMTTCNLSNARLEGADLSEANLRCARFEPLTVPPAALIVTAEHFSSVIFDRPHALQQLRYQYKVAGFRQAEREVTYMLKMAEQNGPDVAWYERWGLWILFDVTCKYGRQPGRPLWILMALMATCTFPYAASLWISGKSGIWKVWPKDRVRQDIGGPPERIQIARPFFASENKFLLEKATASSRERRRLFRFIVSTVTWLRMSCSPVLSSLLAGFTFSLLSAFHYGWKDLDVGNWIMRIQRHEYSLRATGWVRVLSGMQSVVSMYLLALWALTYFGRPFG